jgi:hypothetical protein
VERFAENFDKTLEDDAEHEEGESDGTFLDFRAGFSGD